MKRFLVLTILISLLWLAVTAAAVWAAFLHDAVTHECACACPPKPEPKDYWECHVQVREAYLHCGHGASLCERLYQSDLDLCMAHYDEGDDDETGHTP
jgi:hypothetical protein